MELLNNSQIHTARNTETILRQGLSEKSKRKVALRLMNISNSTMSKFLSGDAPDCKINVVAISRAMALLDLKIVPTFTQQYNPNTHSAVPIAILSASAVLSSIGHSVVVHVHRHGLETLPKPVQTTFEQTQ